MIITVPIQLKYGLRANLPATGVGPGEAYFCIDTGDLFVFDGATMRPIGGSDTDALANLTDVHLTTLGDGNVLTWDDPSQKWTNRAPNIGDLTDATSGTATMGLTELDVNSIFFDFANKDIQLARDAADILGLYGAASGPAALRIFKKFQSSINYTRVEMGFKTTAGPFEIKTSHQGVDIAPDILLTPESGLITGTGSFNATVGFQIGNAAPSGHVLRGNGSNYVDATLSLSDTTNFTAVDLTAQTANIAPTTLFSLPPSNRMYRVSVYIVISQAAGISSVLPDTRIIYTDPDANLAVTVPMTQENNSNVKGTALQNSIVISATASTLIQYDIGQVTSYSSVTNKGGPNLQFAYRVRLEAL